MRLHYANTADYPAVFGVGIQLAWSFEQLITLLLSCAGVPTSRVSIFHCRLDYAGGELPAPAYGPSQGDCLAWSAVPHHACSLGDKEMRLSLQKTLQLGFHRLGVG